MPKSRGPQARDDHQAEHVPAGELVAQVSGGEIDPLDAIARNCSAGANCKLHGGQAVCLDCHAPGERLGLGVPDAAPVVRQLAVGQMVRAWDRETGDFAPAKIKAMNALEILVEYADGMECLVAYSQVRPPIAEENTADRDADIRAGRGKGKLRGFTSDEQAFIGDVLDTVKAWWFAPHNTREEKRQRDKLLGYVEHAAKLIVED